MKKKLLALLIASALPFIAKEAHASAFALAEQGVSGLGNAYAGAAAAAEDASTVWWNPAGMSRLPRGKHLLLGAHVIVPSTKFKNRASTPALGANEGGDAGDTVGAHPCAGGMRGRDEPERGRQDERDGEPQCFR